MSKAKFQADEAALQIGTIGHIDQRQDDVDGGDHQGLGREGGGATFVPFDQIDRRPKNDARGHHTIATAHV